MLKVGLALVVAAAVLSAAGAASAQMQSVFLEGQTDSTGRFTIQHPYLAEPSSCEGQFIAGVTVAIHNRGNNEWYTIADRNQNMQAFAFGDHKVSGYFNLPGYENQPVRVVLFLTNRIC